MKSNIFSKGSRWLRADFHLHTRADREFPYCGTAFVEEYIAALKEEDIAIGVITNHNKFDKDEFKALKKAAKKENIWLLAGLEFSLKEGIHLLIVFKDSWCKGHEDSINVFIKNAFYGIKAYDTAPHRNSRFDLKGTVEALDETGLNYFLVLPHPDDDNGLFRGLKGRTLESFIKDSSFDKVIALQKSGEKSNYKKLCEYAGRVLARVEGSDNAKGGKGTRRLCEDRRFQL